MAGVCQNQPIAKHMHGRIKDLIDRGIFLDQTHDLHFPLVIEFEHLLHLVKDFVDIFSIQQDDIATICTNNTATVGFDKIAVVSDIEKLFF